MDPQALWESTEDLSRIEEAPGDDIISLKTQISKLTKENEKYKQDNYSLQCKLEVSTSMQEELREANELLEKTVNEANGRMSRRICEIEEKHTNEKTDLFSRLSEMELEMLKKTEENNNLQIKIKELNHKLRSTNNELPVIIEDDSGSDEKIADLIAQLLQKDHQIKQIEETINDLNNENVELKAILKGTKQELSEKNEQLENTRDELMGLKMELSEVKEKPASETSKGNSLFAEVEDRRKKMLDQMSAMRKGYHDAKRVVHIKDAEIKSLKAERVALIRRWEDDVADGRHQDSQLIEKYKSHISELERKLQEQHKKYRLEFDNQAKPSANAYSYFQSMLDKKKKEIDELESQLENVSIQAVLEEGMKHQLNRQLRYWRWKAMSGEAKLVAVKSHLEADPECANSNILEILNQPISKQAELEATIDSTNLSPEVVEVSVMTLEKLMKVPDTSEKRDTSIFLGDSLCESFNESYRGPVKLSDLDSSVNVTANRSEDTTDNFTRGIGALKIANADKENRENFREVGDVVKETSKVTAFGENNVPKLKSTLVAGNSCDLAKEKEKKSVKFTGDTRDPPSRILKRQATPKYPIVFVTNKPKKN